MSLAILSIDLEAKLGRFEQDLGKASRSLDKLAANAKGSFSGVGDVFAGSFLASAAEESIRGLVQLFPSLVDGVAAFQDLSDETGASAVALASFQTAADVSGVSVQDLAGMMVRLTGNLAKLTDEGKGAGAALTALGIPIKEFRALAPDEQIKRLAAEFGKFEDSSSKTAVALALFGKSGAQVLKFFKEYEGSASSSIKLTAEMIAQADAFGDAHAKSRSELKQTAQVIAVQMLPAVIALETGFKDAAKAALGMDQAGSGLDARVFLDWAESAAVAVGTLGDAVVGVVRTVQAAGAVIGSILIDAKYAADSVMTVARMGPGQGPTDTVEKLKGLLESRNSTVAGLNQRYLDLWEYNKTAIADSQRKSFAQQRALLDPENTRELARMREKAAEAGSKGKLNFTAATSGELDGGKAFQRFMAQLEEQDALAQAQLETGGKLAESDRTRITLLAKLTNGTKEFTETEVGIGRSKIEGIVATLKLGESERDLTKAREAAQAIDDRAIGGHFKEIEAIIASNDALRDQIEEIGLTADQVEDLRTKRLEHKAAIVEEALALLQEKGATDALLGVRERELEVLRQQIGLRKRAAARTDEISKDPTKGASDALDNYMSKIEQSGTATREVVGRAMGLLEDDLVKSMSTGRFSVTQTVDFIIAEFMRLAVVRPLLGSLFGAFGLTSAVAHADGGAFDAGGAIAFANGGIIDSPMLFRFASGSGMSTGVMGEAGPEAIMPLQRGPNGKLGVRAVGNGGGVVINVTQNNTIGGNVSRSEVAVAMEQAKRSTIAAIADAQRRGRVAV